MTYIGTRADIEAWLIRIAEFGELDPLECKPLERGATSRPLWENQRITLATGEVAQGVGRNPAMRIPTRVLTPGRTYKSVPVLTETERAMKNTMRARARRANASKAKLARLLAEGKEADAKRLIKRVRLGRENRSRGEI
jgi:hypothetical protein